MLCTVVLAIKNMFVQNFSKIAFKIGPVGPIEVRYYSLLFVCGIVGYYFVTRFLWKKEKWPMADFDSLVIYLFFGLLIGARLGEVLFYHPVYYFSHPIEIFEVWNGGLASHGAAIGVFVAYSIFWFFRRRKENRLSVKELPMAKRFKFSKYADALALAMPLVAGFVRIGNFMNSEVVGRATDLPWGVIFVQNGENFARHPVQIYEGLLCWGIFALLFSLYLKKFKELKAVAAESAGRKSVTHGLKSSENVPLYKPYFFLFIFIGIYFTGRFLLEFLKEFKINEPSMWWTAGMTMGQILSIIPIVIALVYFIFFYPKIK